MQEDLSHLSEEQLTSLVENAQRTLKEMQLDKRKEVIAELHRLAASVGLKVEISEDGKSITGRRGRKVAAKYRNPFNQDETWTGRGMQPKWLRSLIEQGRNAEEFLI